MIKKDDLLHIADISNLKFSEEEFEKIKFELEDVIDSVKILDEVDTENVAPLYQVNEDTYHIKNHEDHTTLTNEEALQNTKEKKYGYFKILKVVE